MLFFMFNYVSYTLTDIRAVFLKLTLSAFTHPYYLLKTQNVKLLQTS